LGRRTRCRRRSARRRRKSGFASLFLTLFPFLLYLLSPLVLFFFLFFFICFVLFSLSLVVQMSLSVGPARHHIGVAWHGTDGRETKKKALLTSVRPNQLRCWESAWTTTIGGGRVCSSPFVATSLPINHPIWWRTTGCLI
jgi:hypothetical protein